MWGGAGGAPQQVLGLNGVPGGGLASLQEAPVQEPDLVETPSASTSSSVDEDALRGPRRPPAPRAPAPTLLDPLEGLYSLCWVDSIILWDTSRSSLLRHPSFCLKSPAAFSLSARDDFYL